MGRWAGGLNSNVNSALVSTGAVALTYVGLLAAFGLVPSGDFLMTATQLWIGDMIGVVHQGQLQQWDDAYSLYHRPATRFVADFIGEVNLVEGKVLSASAEELRLSSPITPHPLHSQPQRH